MRSTATLTVSRWNTRAAKVYVSNPEENRGEGVVDIYGPGIVVPDVEDRSRDGRVQRSVDVERHGDACRNEGNATCEFQYATSEFYEATGSYDQTFACSQGVLSGNSPVPVTANVSGLTPNTTYHYRLDATNGNGANDSEDATFTTPGHRRSSVSPVKLPGITARGSSAGQPRWPGNALPLRIRHQHILRHQHPHTRRDDPRRLYTKASAPN